VADDQTCDSVRHEWETTAFVLGELGGEERATMVAHLEHCGPCQNKIASLTGTLADLTGLVPPMTPTPGFVASVMKALPFEHADRSSVTAAPVTTPLGTVTRFPHRRRAWALAATAAVVAGALGIGLGAQATSGGKTSRIESPVVAEMRTSAGAGVGQAVVFDQRPALVTVALDVPAGTSWSPGGPYKVLAIQRNGQSTTLGSVAISRGEGGLQARTAIPASDIATVRVVAPDGQALCAGLIPQGPARRP
jgi:anti-sigma-K factor RskA